MTEQVTARPRARFLFAFAVLGAAACHIETDEPEKAQSSTVEYSAEIAAAGIALLAVEGVNGNITVTASPEVEHIVIDATAFARAATYAEAEAALENLSVQIAEIDGALEVETIQPVFYDGFDYYVDYAILMPSYLALDVVGINGHILSEGTASLVTLSLTNGTISADALLPPHALAELSVVNGDVWLGVPAATSAAVTAQVTNGSVGIEGFDIRNFVVSDESVVGMLGNGDAEIRLQAVNGRVTLSAAR